MYTTRSVILPGTQSVAASQTEQAVSKPFGLSADDSLYLLAKIKLSACVVAAAISFKLQHASGDGTWTNVGSSANATASQKTCTDANVTNATENFNVGTHGYVTGDRVLVSTAGTLPAGLTAGEYWIIKVDADNFKLASSQALALAGTATAISTDGSGTFRFTQADYTVRLLATDSTDVAQLPLWSTCRWVVDTGAGDSCTVSEIRVSTRN